MWREPRTTFHGRYFHVENAVLEPKPVQRPHPPVLIAGGGEQLTLRTVARLADACNIASAVAGRPTEVKHKFDVLRRHCDAAGRDYQTIEKSHVQAWVLAGDAAAAESKRARLAATGLSPSFVGTVSEAIELIGQYERAGVDLLIYSDVRNYAESRELFATEVMPHFA